MEDTNNETLMSMKKGINHYHSFLQENATLPTLNTKRLILRPFLLSDALRVEELASAAEVANSTLSIPHPYPKGGALAWIETHATIYMELHDLTLAIVEMSTGELCGTFSMKIIPHHLHAEIGYWLGVPYWNQGYMSEAALAILDFGFGTLRLNRIFASHFSSNPASGRVMQKIGMTYEGCLRQHLSKYDRFEDCVYYGVLRDEWMSIKSPPIIEQIRPPSQ